MRTSLIVGFSLLLGIAFGIGAGGLPATQQVLGKMGAALLVDLEHMPRPVMARVPGEEPPLQIDGLPDILPGATHLEAASLDAFSVQRCFEGLGEDTTLARPWLRRDTVSPGLTDPVRPTEFPDLAAHPGLIKLEIVHSKLGTDREHCGAVRVAKHWFLTAAHCFQTEDPDRRLPVYDIIAVTPSVDARSPGTRTVALTGAVCHGEHGVSRLRYPTDIALFFLDDVAAFAGVPIARLERGDMYLRADQFADAYIAAWGRNGGSRYLQGGPVSISQFGESVLVSERIGPRGPNVGDSGAPLYIDYGDGPLVVGVLSQVTQDSETLGDTGIYVRAKSVRAWAARTMALCERDGAYIC